ncbi:hypothetical protein HDU77_010077 [Chytriomyces hyalinus]|nr:hypothetical protein HDU77_010077 [Chytriomyces hyalinus]
MTVSRNHGVKMVELKKIVEGSGIVPVPERSKVPMIYDKFTPGIKIKQQYGISTATLRLWSERGKIRCTRPNAESNARGGKRFYHIEDVERILGTTRESER